MKNKKKHSDLIISENIGYCLFQTVLYTLEHVRPYPNKTVRWTCESNICLTTWKSWTFSPLFLEILLLEEYYNMDRWESFGSNSRKRTFLDIAWKTLTIFGPFNPIMLLLTIIDLFHHAIISKFHYVIYCVSIVNESRRNPRKSSSPLFQWIGRTSLQQLKISNTFVCRNRANHGTHREFRGRRSFLQ